MCYLPSLFGFVIKPVYIIVEKTSMMVTVHNCLHFNLVLKNI